MNSPLLWASKVNPILTLEEPLLVNTWNIWTRAYDYELWFNLNILKHERQHNEKDNKKKHSHEKKEVHTIK